MDTKKTRTFVGFGFGAIQGGLFLLEAFRSGQFARLVVAEVQPDVVRAVRAAGGRYRVNIATPDGLVVQEVSGVEVFNPQVAEDREPLVKALRDADELATALPSVETFDQGEGSVARLLAEASAGRTKPAVLYAGENHNHAAELLHAAMMRRGGEPGPWQFLNTVIGKMSGVVTDPAEMAVQSLAPICDGLPRAFLVEVFNRILISRVNLPDFSRGLGMFEEKDDLLPFEEAKLYGHNAVHALLGLLAHERGLRFMSEIAGTPDLLELGRQAFLLESGGALRHRYAGVDELFTVQGFQAYADDLLQRMINPFLRDAVARVIRDPARKLGWDDRLIGTMRRALAAGLRPVRFARGARLALQQLAPRSPGRTLTEHLEACWDRDGVEPAVANELKELIGHAC